MNHDSLMRFFTENGEELYWVSIHISSWSRTTLHEAETPDQTIISEIARYSQSEAKWTVQCS